MTFAIGSRVRLLRDHAPTGGSPRDGATGSITDYDADEDRWHVKIDETGEEHSFEADELVVLNGLAAPRLSRMQAEGLQDRAAPPHLPEAALRHRSTARSRALSDPSRRPPSSGTSEEITRLRMTILEWQDSNTQWQAAYAQLTEKYVQLENDNRHLRDVIEAAESGPDMNARFVARLARQNFRLGQEVAALGVDTTIGDTPPLSDRVIPGSDDSGRDMRPAGVNRLPLRRQDDEVPAVAHSQWDDINESSDMTTDEDSGKKNGESRSQELEAESERLRKLMDEKRKEKQGAGSNEASLLAMTFAVAAAAVGGALFMARLYIASEQSSEIEL